jgi:hypothetical protein
MPTDRKGSEERRCGEDGVEVASALESLVRASLAPALGCLGASRLGNLSLDRPWLGEADLERYVLTASYPNSRINLARQGEKYSPRSLPVFRRGFANGETVVLEQSDLSFPEVSEVARTLARCISTRVGANIYWSRKNVPGFGCHFDDHDVLILQVAGEKVWRIRGRVSFEPNPGSLYPIPDPLPTVQEEHLLKQGDVLFIPRGCWHDALARSHSTVHVTFGIFASTMFEYVEFLARAARLESWALERIPLEISNEPSGRFPTREAEGFKRAAEAFAAYILTTWQERYEEMRRERVQSGELSNEVPLINPSLDLDRFDPSSTWLGPGAFAQLIIENLENGGVRISTSMSVVEIPHNVWSVVAHLLETRMVLSDILHDHHNRTSVAMFLELLLAKSILKIYQSGQT